MLTGTASAVPIHFQQYENSDLINDQDIKLHLMQWGLSNLKLQFYSIQHAQLSSLSPKEIILSFLNSGQVRVMTASGQFGSLGKVSIVEFEELNCTNVKMDLFDILKDNDIIREYGEIVKCIDEYTEDQIVVSDELRKCLLIPESESYDLFTIKDRQELLFQLFRLLVLGGSFCQYEDYVEPYFDVCKKLFNSIIKEGIISQTQAFRLHSVDSSLAPLFPIQHPINNCFILIDYEQQSLCFLYHSTASYY